MIQYKNGKNRNRKLRIIQIFEDFNQILCDLQVCFAIFDEFFGNVSINGVRYFCDRKRHWTERCVKKQFILNWMTNWRPYDFFYSSQSILDYSIHNRAIFVLDFNMGYMGKMEWKSGDCEFRRKGDPNLGDSFSSRYHLPWNKILCQKIKLHRYLSDAAW